MTKIMSNIEPSRPAIEWCSLKNGTAGPLDNDLSKFLGSLQDREVPIGINLSQIKFLEPASMIFILAIFNELKRNNRPTTIQFPTNFAVRRIMGTWKFLETLKIIGHSTVQTASADFISRSDRRDDLEAELEKSYLPIKFICGINGHDRPSNEHVDGELERFNETLMMAWLQSHLVCPEGMDRLEWRNFVRDTFPSRIVFEAVMNSVRHPNATRILTTSHIQWNPNKPDSGWFTCVWWDDGKGIVKTLSEAIEAGRPIISSAPALPERQCSIMYKNAKGGQPRYLYLTTNYIPNNDSTDEEILFSSMCSRITRDPKGIGHRTKLSGDIPKDSPLRQPGMGLYILVDCAVNIFGGSISFRTGNLFMNVGRGKKKGPRKGDYAVSISCPSDTFQFPGNMLIVRLPILKQSRLACTG